MSENEILTHATQALTLILLLSLPPILVAAIVGTLVSLLQALTQIQEQTISFAIKLVAIIGALFATANWIGVELLNYSQLTFIKAGQL